MTRSRGDLALVLSGGGARGAYQVGVLSALARARPTLEFDVLTGVSAGAINAAFLASHPGPLGERVAALRRLWLGIDVDSVIEVADRWFLQNVLRVGLQLVSGGHLSPPKSRGLVSTAPLGELLSEHLEPDSLGVIPGIERNLRSGRHKAVAITGSCFSTGRSVTWVAGRPLDLWERPNRRAEATPIRLEHVMASAALPLLFPAVEVDGQWYGDGGVRLTAPLAPAIHLGASRLLTVSTRFAGRANDPERESGRDYPPPAQVAGVLLNAIFLDLIDADALHLERINRLLSESPNGAHGGLRPIALEVLRPSEDLGAIANAFEARMPRGLRFLTRGLGTRRTRTNDLLSLLMFQHDYVGRLIELGERDGAERLDQMLALVDG
jgi:NTE family protein